MKKPTIVFATMCKNEEHIIRKTLESVYKFIDYWIICDTGSTDKTREIITEFFKEKNIPGELFVDEWEGFDKNKTLMIQRAQGKADYIFHMDADDALVGDFIINEDEVGLDSYHMTIKRGSLKYKSLILFKADYKWKFCGVAHTTIKCLDKPDFTIGDLQHHNYCIAAEDIGARSFDPKKYLYDAERLQKQFYDTIEDDPDNLNSRSAFYTAQSYMDYGMYEEAIKWNKTYLGLKNTWIEEVFEAQMRIANCHIVLNSDSKLIEKEMLKAISIFPDRAEPYYYLGEYFNSIDKTKSDYYFKQADSCDLASVKQKYVLFINENCYRKPSSKSVPKVLYIGPGRPKLTSEKYYNYEDDSLNVYYTTNDNNLEEILISFKPDAIVTIGKSDSDFSNLYNQTPKVRNKWLHFTELTSEVGQQAYYCAMYRILENDNSSLISFFTPIYNTGKKLYNTYESLVKQTYQNWEWILVNDSTDNITLKIAEELANKDHRVKVYDFKEKSKGNIGEVKYRAAMLCKGYLLAELDHDDLLTENCAMDLYNASQAYPDAGFFFTDWVEINEQGESLTYSDGWGCGYGKYYEQNGWQVADQHNINPKTIHHIVGIPNHIRAWRRDTYLAVGGHNRNLTIADDYELVVRTFLKTKFCKISKLGYIQIIYQNQAEQNSHDASRADIQRRIRSIANYYNEAIKDRFEELGVKDWVYEANIDPMSVPSRYGDDEGYVNYIF